MQQAMQFTRLAWNSPPSARPISLPETEIHVWRAGVSHSSTHVSKLTNILAADEFDRAKRYRFETDRHRFIIGRGLLRHLLSHYLKISPRDLKFDYGPFGKPSLDVGLLDFNVAHSKDMILLAFSARCKVGIDIESMDAEVEVLKLAPEFCSPTELENLSILPNAERQQAFFQLWTRKEAFLKATGEGLSRSPVDLNIASDGRWQILDLDVAPNYAASLVYERNNAAISGWNANELQIA